MLSSTPTAPYGPGPDDVLAGTAAPGPGPSTGGSPPTPAVVVGVDGGECALGAVRWAAEEALRRGAPLRLVHAAPYLGRRTDPEADPPELPRARRIVGQAYTAARHVGAGVHAETEIVAEEPARTLLKAAAEAQLVVLGICTTGAADELVLAPVAQRVVARSTTPVVVVPRPRGTAAGGAVVALLGLGDADDEEPVADWSAETARRSGAALTVVLARGATHDQRDWAERYGDLQVTVRDLRHASPGDLLGTVCPAPLMVLSAGHGSILHRWLDGPHRYLLRHCTSPMALIPPVHRPEREPQEEIIAVG